MTKEEYRELEILLGGLQVIGLSKSTEERLEKSLQVIHRDKQLLIHGVVKSFDCYDKTVANAEEDYDYPICDKQCEKCKQ